MKRAFAFSCFTSFAVLAACVPASEELPAAGAAGFETIPTAATQGETFTTIDGWNVTFEKLVVQLSVSASASSRGYGSSEPYIFDARRSVRVFSRALPVGPATVSASLYGRYIGYDEDDYFDRVERIDVDDETNARFNRLPDDVEETNRYTPGPSLLMIVRAERDGRTITIDVALNVTAISRGVADFGTPVDVREDVLTTAELPIDAALFFPTFDAVAAADGDGDGRVTATELMAASVLAQLEQRMSAVFVR